MIASLLLAMSAISADEIRPDKFYVAGVSQSMTLADYNALIANGGYKSEPIGPDRFRAVIDSQAIYVDFCNGRVVQAISEHVSSDWLESIVALEKAGFTWTDAGAYVEQNNLRTGYFMLTTKVPKGFTYFATPMVKGATINGRELGTFQIMFQSVDNACRQ